MLKRGCKPFVRLLTLRSFRHASTRPYSLQTNSARLSMKRLPSYFQPTRDKNPDRISIPLDMAHSKKNVLFTHMKQKQIIMQYIECVLQLYGAFDRRAEIKRKRRGKKRMLNRKVSLIFFLQFVILSFSSSGFASRIPMPTTKRGILLGELMLRYSFRIFRRSAGLERSEVKRRWNRSYSGRWEKS